jgi:hypothetical protein
MVEVPPGLPGDAAFTRPVPCMPKCSVPDDRILIVATDDDTRGALARVLAGEGRQVRQADDAIRALGIYWVASRHISSSSMSIGTARTTSM